MLVSIGAIVVGLVAAYSAKQTPASTEEIARRATPLHTVAMFCLGIGALAAISSWRVGGSIIGYGIALTLLVAAGLVHVVARRRSDREH